MVKRKQKSKKADPTYLPGSRVKMSFRRHVLPPLMGVLAMIIVIGWFNSQWIVAKVSSWTYRPPATAQANDQSLAANQPDPNAPPRLTISNITVDAPVNYEQKTISEANFQKALQSGVVHYPGTALPGQPGNVVIFGHSSGQVWAPGDYKFVFAHLEKLELNNKIFLDYQGTRYIYEVVDKEVVPPTDVSVLQPTKENSLTLITCHPVGTNQNRLIITAKQIVPKPTIATEAPQAPPHTEIETLPSNTPSLVENIRSLF